MQPFSMIRINTALISVFNKSVLDELGPALLAARVKIYSTGGTADYLRQAGHQVVDVESITGFPSILGGRVKTLHPAVFGGILRRPDLPSDQRELNEYHLPEFDLVVVDLYPFQATVAAGAPEADVIEKIDIGGVSLIRAAAKNFAHVAVVAGKNRASLLAEVLAQKGTTDLAWRKQAAAEAFAVVADYDKAIADYFQATPTTPLRYGENPHQKGKFEGILSEFVEQLHGKELSYNNLLDVDAALRLIRDFRTACAVAIIKHNNACGFAVRSSVKAAYTDALAGDPVSAFGGIVVSSQTIDTATAAELNQLFCEIVVAPGFDAEALALLKSKKNRILLVDRGAQFPAFNVRSALNGALVQEVDGLGHRDENWRLTTSAAPTDQGWGDAEVANKLAKHSKSNAIILVKNGQLCGSGVGQTSRIDALKQAIEKAQHFGFDLSGSCMASDAFFPFSDCVELAHAHGISMVIHPGGSLRDQESIDFCEAHGMSMIITGTRHFKH